MTKKALLGTAITIATTQVSLASLTWTGNGDAISLFQEANWNDDGGSPPAGGSINPGAAVTANTGASNLIEINSGTGTPSNYGGGAFNVGGGNSLTVGGAKTLASLSNQSVIGGGAATTLTVTGGATLNVGNVSNFGTIAADASTVDLSAVTGVTDLTLTNVSGSINSLTMASGTISMTGTSPSFTTVDLTGVTGNIANMTITNGTLDLANSNNPTFGNLVLDNSDATYAGTGGLNSSLANPSNIHLTNGSTWISQFITTNSHLFVDATSSIELKGTGDPINSQVEQSSVNLVTGSQLIFRGTPGAELADQINDSGTGDIWVNGIRVTALNSSTLLTTSDGLTYTAVPEPSSSALLGLGGLALILRRRK